MSHGRPVLLRPSIARAKLHELIASLPACTIGMEACSGAHHRARLFRTHGHTVRLMAPKFVAPYRMSGARGKNDAADAAATVRRCSDRTCTSFQSRVRTSKPGYACIGSLSL